ncbi:YjbQ family protein [Candidatus Aerophobetes bacterium]|nr:YjbQ family protein [Candidatus Aerophobetes bacterium]
MVKILTISTHSRVEFIDITGDIERVAKELGVKSGICWMFVPHTTAGITINEGADPSVQSDIINQLDKIVPLHGDYHHLEGNSAAHIKASLIGCSDLVFIEDGRLKLGTWQSIYFCEFDGPRTRRLMVKITQQ